MPRRLALLLAALAACLALVPAAAQARTAVRVGIGDQSAAMFDQPAFQRAKLKRVRYFIAWNAMDNTAARLAARAYVQRARRDGFSVLLHVSSDTLRDQEGQAAVGRAVPLEGRAPGAVLPRPRRARVRHVERGQPRQPADLSQPDPGRAVLPRDVPHGQGALLVVRGGGARRPRPDRRRALHADLVPRAVGDLSPPGHARGHPQLRRRQPRAHDVHAQASSARRTSTTARRTSGSPRPAGS